MLLPGSPKVEQILDDQRDGVPDLAFGNFVLGSIHGIKYEDVNGNGLQDSGEPPVGGVIFTLTGTDGKGDPIAPLEMTSDNQTGEFWFEDLVPGTYSVTETLPTDWGTSTGEVVSGIVVDSRVEWVAFDGQAMLPPGSPKI